MTETLTGKQEVRWEDQPIIITAGMWDAVQRENALIRRRISALAHATGANRTVFDTESGEADQVLSENDFIDIFSASEEKLVDISKEKADLIFELLIEKQKQDLTLVYRLVSKDVLELFGIKNRNVAIDYMHSTAAMYTGRVYMQKFKGGPSGFWAIVLTNDEISKLKIT